MKHSLTRAFGAAHSGPIHRARMQKQDLRLNPGGAPSSHRLPFTSPPSPPIKGLANPSFLNQTEVLVKLAPPHWLPLNARRTAFRSVRAYSRVAEGLRSSRNKPSFSC